MKNFFSSVLLAALLRAGSATPILSETTDVLVPVDHELNVRTTASCALCIAQCAGAIVVCAAACGPGEVFGPEGCANCLVVFGASQQCFQCVEKCEKTKDGAVFDDCSAQDYTANTCTDENAYVGLCSVPQYTVYNYATNGGIGCANGLVCDWAVANEKGCRLAPSVETE